MLYGIDTRWHGKGVTFSGSPSLTQLNHHIHLHSPLPSCHKHRHTNHGKGFITLVQQKHHSSLTSRFTFTFSQKTNTQAKTSVNCSPLSPSLSELWQPPPSSNVSCATTFVWPALPLESAPCLLRISLRLPPYLLRLSRTTCSSSTRRCSEP